MGDTLRYHRKDGFALESRVQAFTHTRERTEDSLTNTCNFMGHKWSIVKTMIPRSFGEEQGTQVRFLDVGPFLVLFQLFGCKGCVQI